MVRNTSDIWVSDTIKNIENKMELVSEKSKNKIPYTTINGVHDDRSSRDIKFASNDGINWWCNGFWGGIMWQMYNITGLKHYADIANNSEKKLDQCFFDYSGLHHDVGFMWLPTAVTNFKITENAESRKRGMHAANLLAGRFNTAGNYIRAWNDFNDNKSDTRGWTIIDCMFNIPLLYWASEESKDPRFKQIAMLHADTVMNTFVRSDGSVKHIVEFDPETGEMIKEYGGQGYAEGSSWTRGQTWGLYGFVISYIHTGKIEYLDTAKKIAHYFIANIPDDGLIPVDFRQPNQPYYYDDTAAAIASSGLLEIARQVGELEKDMYIKPAVKMLKALVDNHCCWDKENDCILTKCTAAYHSTEHEISIIYGDYFFIEAILKVEGKDIFIW